MIDNGSSDVVLPEQLQKRIDLSKKQLAVNEQELITLQKARAGEEYALRELLKQKDEAIKAIAVQEELQRVAISDTAKIQQENEDAVAEHRRLSTITSELEKTIANQKAYTDDREARLNQGEAALDIIVKEQVERKETLDAQQAKIEKFMEAIKKAIKLF
jgi:hypothetical protein